MEKWHRSVLLDETVSSLGEIRGGRFADLTFGEGGHTEELLNRGAAEVIAVDRDREAIDRYLKSGAMKDDKRLKLLHGNLSSFPDVPLDGPLDGILMDLGVSTRQILESERGFSFTNPGPLDMRMNRDDGQPLSELLRDIEEDELANIIYANTDLKSSRRAARQILFAFKKGELETTAQLAELFKDRRPGPHYGSLAASTVIFLALRMWVNDEGGEVRDTVPRLIPLLKVGGRLAVITFHSSEDRWVKNIFQALAGKCVCFSQPCSCVRKETVRWITKKPVAPSDKELAENPRSRSALLRCVERLE